MDLIERFCLRDDLATYDPYDIWKTRVGARVKKFYNSNPRIGSAPAAALALFDDVVNNRARLFYRKQEYPIVRATAALTLLNLYESTRDEKHAGYAKRHLDWLVEHRSRGYRGWCWGLGFANSITKNLSYEADTPYTTMTPYALEAMVRYEEITGERSFEEAIDGVRRFFEEDVVVMEEDESAMATSYAPFRDRIVINAVSYAMYSHALLVDRVANSERSGARLRIRKLYEYVRRHQRADGSWLYSPEGSSFIDCFHSCIVLKNLIKAGRRIVLEGLEDVMRAGFAYLREALFDAKEFLFRRFSMANKPGLVRFDLYDNAEALNVAVLAGDSEFAERLTQSILRHFVAANNIYSQIDCFGVKRGRNTLRWAVMPFLYAASTL